MDKDNVVHICNRILFICKENEIIKGASQQMELENTILSEVTQIHKDKRHMFSNSYRS